MNKNILLIFFLCFVVYGNAAPFIIDGFDDPSGGAFDIISTSLRSRSDSNVGDIGATRDLSYSINTSSALMNLNESGTGSKLDIGGGSGKITTVQLAYSSLTEDDFTAGGANTALSFVTASNIQQINITVKFSASGDDYTFSKTDLTGGNLIIDFQEFKFGLTEATDADFETVYSLVIDITSEDNEGYTLDGLETISQVPEPSTYLLLGVLGLLGIFRKKFKKNKVQ